MNKRTIFLGRILGISIGLDYSWFLVFALITWALATGYFPFEIANALPAAYWFLGAFTAILFFGSVLLHELGHSVVALRFKVPVRRITLFIFGGIAEIGAEPPNARAEFLIAIAGPIVSFALAALFAALEISSAALAPLFVLAKYLAFINGSLALFNLIPGFPLDGGRVFRAIVWRVTDDLNRATRIAANLGRVVAFLFIAFGIWQVSTGDIGGLWIALIGWFLLNTASAELQEQSLHEALASHAVSEVMSRSYITVTPETTLQTLVDQHLPDIKARAFVVQQDRGLIGVLSWQRINAAPRSEWRTITAAQVMTPIIAVKSVQPDTKRGLAIEEMRRNQVNEVAVVAERHPLGMLSRQDIISFLRQHHLLRA